MKSSLSTVYLLKIFGPLRMFLRSFFGVSIFFERPPPCFFLINSNIFSFWFIFTPPLQVASLIRRDVFAGIDPLAVPSQHDNQDLHISLNL